MSITLKNDRMLRVFRGEPVDSTPVWMMRQAGRYLPEYRATRAKAGDFLSLCKNRELACEVTLQPLDRYPLDAAILFSDILTIPDAMGLGLYFEEGEGPRFKTPVTSLDQIRSLPTDVLDELQYVMEAVSLIRSELNGRVPLIGFSGSPWTLATYMVEGRSTRDFSIIKRLLYSEPEALHLLLEKLAKVVSAYLVEQVKSGAQVLQVFDTWGGVLAENAYLEFSLSYMESIVSHLRQSGAEAATVPVILFTKGGGNWLEKISATGCHGIGLDWTVNIAGARKKVGDDVVLQGNMDPAVLRAPIPIIESEVQRILAEAGSAGRHIFNLGHGITPDIDPSHAGAFIEAVKKYSTAYHQ